MGREKFDLSSDGKFRVATNDIYRYYFSISKDRLKRSAQQEKTNKLATK